MIIISSSRIMEGVIFNPFCIYLMQAGVCKHYISWMGTLQIYHKKKSSEFIGTLDHREETKRSKIRNYHIEADTFN